MGTPIHFKTATELSKMLASKEITSKEITKAFIERTKAVESKVDAFLSWDETDAIAQAEASDARRAKGAEFGPFDGIPIALKDVIAVTGQPLTAGSKILENYVSPYDSTVTAKLKSAGAVLWGRTNLDEFAMGSSTENSAYKVSKNPWNTGCVAGGSSGGSCAAVTAGQAPLSLGTDTGGSIRQPASLCGVVGVKPTYGRVSRYGIAALASSLDQVGPFARTVEDAALVLQTIAGHDEHDSTSLNAPVPKYTELLKEKVGSKTIGIPKEYFSLTQGLDPQVGKAVEAAIEFYRSQGHKLVEVSLPYTNVAMPVYYIIQPAEAASNLSRYDGIRYGRRSKGHSGAIDIYGQSRAEGFGPETKRRILLGTYVLNSGYYDQYYVRAQKVRTLIRQDFTKVFESGVDAIITPTSPIIAFPIGAKAADPLAMYLADIFTIPANLAGLCGISIPCGFSDQGLPIGMQLLCKPLGEGDMFCLAHQFEQAHEFHKAVPSL
jgi:aspartyl-tRNA(Asn)/glutamyl-tRNA(Gln) amidotransferase subunit A